MSQSKTPLLKPIYFATKKKHKSGSQQIKNESTIKDGSFLKTVKRKFGGKSSLSIFQTVLQVVSCRNFSIKNVGHCYFLNH
jgi:hypothetical protein